MTAPTSVQPVGDVGPVETAPLPRGCTEGYVATNGIRLHYVAAGSGPLVLLLHGFPEFWYSWRYQLPVLAAAGLRAVALDLRGYNLSDKPSTGYDVPTLCRDVLGVIEAFGERQADIVGHDWGGILAWAFALREPAAVRRLAVLDAPHPAAALREMTNPRQWRRSSYIAFFQLPALPEQVFARNEYATVWRIFRSADRARAWLSDADIERYVTAIARPGALPAALAYYRQLVRRGPGAVSPIQIMHTPTLLLWGEQDRYLGPSLTEDLGPWVRNLRVQRFPTAGHWLNQERALDVNTALVDFLRPGDARAVVVP